MSCGCEFEAKQFEYNQHHHTETHAHHNTQHGITEPHDHDAMMADPRMARFMEADMRARFWWSLALTVPAVLYSPLGIRLLAPYPPLRVISDHYGTPA